MATENINLVSKIGTITITDDVAVIGRESVVATSKYVTSGVWYWEVTLDKIDSSNYGYMGVGVGSSSLTAYNNNNVTMFNNKYSSRIVIYNGASEIDSLPFTMNEKDTVGVVLDANIKTIQFFFKNGISKKYDIGHLVEFSPVTMIRDATVTITTKHNFGQRDFELLGIISDSINDNYPSSKIIAYNNSKAVNTISKVLLKSKNRIYAVKFLESNYDIVLTSNNTPVPYVATASTQNNPAWNAFNPNNANWYANATPPTGGHWIQLKLDSPREFDSVNLLSEVISGSSYGLKNFKILGSNDGVNFEELLTSVKENNGSSSDHKFKKSSSYLYYRIQGNSYHSENAVLIKHITFHMSESRVVQIPTVNLKNILTYGEGATLPFDLNFKSMDYILQETVSEDNEGLWKQDLQKKPLSIKFK